VTTTEISHVALHMYTPILVRRTHHPPLRGALHIVRV